MEVLGLLPLLEFPCVKNIGGKKERKKSPRCKRRRAQMIYSLAD